MTREALAILRNIPSLRRVPPNTLIAVASIAAVFGLFFIFIFIFLLINASHGEHKPHKESPESHKLILDLQKTLIEEMKGTSRQNWIMIILTLIFIVITVTGGGISIIFYKKIKIVLSGFVPGIFENLKLMFNK